MSDKNQKSALILLARLDSQRLPGKGLKDLNGRPVLGRTVDRLRRCMQVNDIILATSNRPIDDALEEFATDENIKIFRGDAHDVAGRCLACCQTFGLNWFVRICGDSPFVDPVIVDEVASTFKANDCDIATNVFPRGYPIGASAEAISTTALQTICERTDDLEYLEHVTFYAYEHAQDFDIINVPPKDDHYADFSIAVDTAKELEMARWITAALNDTTRATLDEVLAQAEIWKQKNSK